MNGKTHMNVTNTGQKRLHIYKDQNIGVVDLRSVDNFLITRNNIHKCLQQKLIFLKEEES